jgi:hypothetical protein
MFRRPRLTGPPLRAPRLPANSFTLPDLTVMRNRRYRDAYSKFADFVVQVAESSEVVERSRLLVSTLTPPLLEHRIDGESLNNWLTSTHARLADFGEFLVRCGSLGYAVALTEQGLDSATSGLVHPFALNLMFFAKNDFPEDLPVRIQMVGDFLVQGSYYLVKEPRSNPQALAASLAAPG